VDARQAGNREAAAMAAHDAEMMCGKVVEYLYDMEKQV